MKTSPATGLLRLRGAGCCLFLAWLVFSGVCFQGTDSTATLRAKISPLQCRPSLGQKLCVPCKGFTAFPESGIMYWLANGSFVDELYPSGAVRETDTVEKAAGKVLRLERTLIFRSFTWRDWHTNFECIIVDPAGLARKMITWMRPAKSTRDTEGSAEAEDPK
ncbi:interleukin-18-binding protein [Hemicordylus capensis]|uniref:interleukin-18-binding protein n=1 Tax=Hemicordylus capensis TaxID=884348 RepID=UPI00230414D0|nr:interleukin-18-binding protein [Hemicordylus capensis]